MTNEQCCTNISRHHGTQTATVATYTLEGITHTMHQIKHEQHLCIAHTLKGTHIACPVKESVPLSCPFVASKTEIEIYKVTQTHRKTHCSNNTAVYFAIYACNTQQND